MSFNPSNIRGTHSDGHGFSLKENRVPINADPIVTSVNRLSKIVKPSYLSINYTTTVLALFRTPHFTIRCAISNEAYMIISYKGLLIVDTRLKSLFLR